MERIQRTIDAPDQDWLTEQEAADWLRLGIDTFRSLVRWGYIAGERRLGRKCLHYYWKGIVIASWRMAMGDMPQNRSRSGSPFEIPECLDEIKDQLCHKAEGTGVYFLVVDGEVIYVGLSLKTERRLIEHREGLGATKQKDFDVALFLPTPEEALSEVEKSWIKRLKPRLNVTHNP